MANNRMFLRCKTCGQTLMIAKTLQSGYCLWDGSGDVENRINIFLHEHTFCDKDRNNSDYAEFIKEGYPLAEVDDVAEENNFDIVYEFNLER